MKQEVVVYECDNCKTFVTPPAPFDFPKDWLDVQVRKNDGITPDQYQLCTECTRAVKLALMEVKLVKD